MYINEGIMQDYPAPQVDAKVFVNYGTFDVQTGLQYDLKGNLTQNSNGQTYAWDPENLMASATVPGEPAQQHSY
jgi:hypothetical protein